MFNYTIGMKIGVVNPMDGQPDYGTVVLIEPDFELGFRWLYIKSDSDSMNTKWDPRLGSFWRLIEEVNPYICLPD